MNSWHNPELFPQPWASSFYFFVFCLGGGWETIECQSGPSIVHSPHNTQLEKKTPTPPPPPTPNEQEQDKRPFSLHDAPFQWLQENSIPKIYSHNF
jgi:hypothetical protein